MKFLLVAVNAKYIHSNPAVYSLRAYAKKYEEHIKIAEYTINMKAEDILVQIYKERPDVIAFSCYIWNITLIKEIIDGLHKISPKLPIWLGGPEVSYCAENLVKQNPFFVGIMVGEGEETFLEVMRFYVEKDIALMDIKGIVSQNGKTPERALTNMNTLLFLYEKLEYFENRIIYYESSRGCPFRCSYCLSSIDKSVRLRDVELVKKELAIFLVNKVKQVKFVDRTFNCNHRHAKAIWNFLKEQDNGITNFHFEISADILDEEELRILKSMRPGLVQLEIGVQSTNANTIKAINRSMDLEKLSANVESIHAARNIHQHLDLIAGLPFEDYKTFQKSFNDVYKMKPEQLQLGFLKVLKGSFMEEKAGEYGINYTTNPPYEVLYSKWMSYEELRKLKAVEEMLEIYYNSSQFSHVLSVLEEVFETPFRMYEELANFYERKGFFLQTPSRMYRYEVLLQFIREVDIEFEELYSELLIYDIYLRENSKRRPIFAKDITMQKEAIRLFYQQEEGERTYLKTYDQYDSKQLCKMTHLEGFCYPVWETDKTKVRIKLSKEQYVLFDYQNKNPLNAEAKTYLV